MRGESLQFGQGRPEKTLLRGARGGNQEQPELKKGQKKIFCRRVTSRLAEKGGSSSAGHRDKKKAQRSNVGYRGCPLRIGGMTEKKKHRCRLFSEKSGVLLGALS